MNNRQRLRKALKAMQESEGSEAVSKLVSEVVSHNSTEEVTDIVETLKRGLKTTMSGHKQPIYYQDIYEILMAIGDLPYEP